MLPAALLWEVQPWWIVSWTVLEEFGSKDAPDISLCPINICTAEKASHIQHPFACSITYKRSFSSLIWYQSRLRKILSCVLVKFWTVEVGQILTKVVWTCWLCFRLTVLHSALEFTGARCYLWPVIGDSSSALLLIFENNASLAFHSNINIVSKQIEYCLFWFFSSWTA